MSKKIAIFVLLFTFLFGTMAYAHSGRTDSSGGHNCSEKSQAKGLCSGYHSHNGGGSTSSSGSSSSSSSTSVRTDKNCSDFATYDEMIQYWNSKGYSATYDPENLDGWGNGQVDDGIPCEAPSGYDKTKINNSPEQIQYNQDQQDQTNGDKQGYAQGLNDGYQEATNNSIASTGSDAFKQGYASGYNRGYEEGNSKVEADKGRATDEGFALGQTQDNIIVPDTYVSHPSLKKSFEDGFNKAVTERVEAKKKEYIDLGYNDGKKDTLSSPKDVEEIYITSYQEGFDKAQNELKEEYVQQGYESAFTMVKYKEPDLANEKFKDWYKEGFVSNNEIAKIKNAALDLGKQGEELSIPSQYKQGESIFTYYYELGLKEHEEQQNANQKAAAGGIGAVALAWLGRRLYVAKRMIS
ncbi:YHYH domain-containing protein [Bacillus sp. V3B]|uniref:YHYH domain-containing protein n=1 Tax=Bacillus sp. V3B TaxID=2804915 RepID=UPI00210E6668|nr:YHYH domain-containing protein [Bacillus sp. V3B]MCQ6277059.1 YHYH domain-containing protein [Bacillus sp. V3B]